MDNLAASGQPDSALLAIRLIFSVVPAVFMGIGVIIMVFMKLDKKKHQEIIENLNRKENGNG